jgi:glycerate kinase
MRILIAPGAFTGTLTAGQAASAVARGWRRHAPDDDLELCPLSGGGPGLLDALHESLGGRLSALTVPGPLGDLVPAAILLVDGADGVPTAYLETTQACGLHLVPPELRDPTRTSTAGVGTLLQEARAAGARRIVLGLDGSATNDAGAGMLAVLAGDDPADGALATDALATDALATDARARLLAGGGALRGVTAAELAGLARVRDRWSGFELVIAGGPDEPLLGLHGTSAVHAQEKGATPEQAQALERCLGDFVAAATAALDLDRSAATAPGAGVGGGLAFGLLLLGGRRVAGAQALSDAVGLADRIRRSDLVVTGEGRFDWRSLRDGVVAGVAAAALEVGTPVVVIAGQVEVGRREALAIGVESAYPVARSPQEVEAALVDPVGTLAGRAERVARTWSP